MAKEQYSPSSLDLPYKQCSRCTLVKALDEFHCDTASIDGHCYFCKTCAVEISAHYYQDNKVAILQKEKDKRLITAQHRTQVREALLSTLKECLQCHSLKELRHFSTKKTSRSLFHDICRSCTNTLDSQKHRERLTPEQKAALNTDSRAARQTNLVVIRHQERTNYAKNRSTRLTQVRQRRRTNPDQFSGYKLARRARKKNLPVLWTPAHAQFAWQYWGTVCAVCQQEEGLWCTIVFDHFIPLRDQLHSPGTVPWNLLPLCNTKKGAPLAIPPCCNQSKRDKDPFVWLTQKLGTRKAQAKLREIEQYFTAARAYADTLMIKEIAL